MYAAGRSPRNLLVVEDVPTHQLLIRALLMAGGYGVVDVVSNGREAVQAHQLRTYELILMDCHMPELDGWEATRQIRRRERELNLRRVPIIAFTGDTMESALHACTTAGMDDFLIKPYEPRKMAEVLSRWLPHPIRE